MSSGGPAETRTFTESSSIVDGVQGETNTEISKTITNTVIPNPGFNYTANQLYNFLAAQIRSSSTKVLANPTLILSEYSGPAGDGEIGREFGNDGYVEVGDKVPVNAEPEEGSSICSIEYGLVGIKLGARILGIDNNDYITFTISPEITGISETVSIGNCPDIYLLSTRKVDTGSIRVKDNDTLILTGVLQDVDTEKIFKTPLLGDLPVLGRLFKRRSVSKEKRELVILVTPNIINEPKG